MKDQSAVLPTGYFGPTNKERKQAKYRGRKACGNSNEGVNVPLQEGGRTPDSLT